jgi:hypothetical protein
VRIKERKDFWSSLDAALWAAEKGFAVVPMAPVFPGQRKMAADKWSPENNRWGTPGFLEPDEVEANWPDRRVGTAILAGPSNLVCIDLDVEEDGWYAGWCDLDRIAGSRSIPATMTTNTGSGGTHLIFRVPNGKKFKTCSAQVAPNIDVRGYGGLFVIHSGNPRFCYTIEDDRDPVLIPGWLADILPLAGERNVSSANSQADNDIDIDYLLANGAPVGRQEYILANLVWSARNDGLSPDIAYSIWSTILSKSVTGIDKKGNTAPPWTRKDFDDKWEGVDRKIRPLSHGLSSIDDTEPIVRGGIKSMSADDYNELDIEWLNRPFFPFGYLVMVDGDPGQGKSLITTSVVANAASGKPVLPIGESQISDPIHCGMIGAEDDIEESVIGRLRAAGYVRNRHIWFMKLKRKKGKKGKKNDIEVLTFPDGIERVREFIVVNRLRLLVIDPVSAFIGENIQTHNDASVRRALGPLVDVAKMTGCCIILVRHLNKSGQMKAMYRGSGSIAFSGIARSGLITGELPNGDFGIAQVKCSYARRFKGTLTYSISEWEENEEIPIIAWRDEVETDADYLIGGPKSKKGPEPFSQNAIMDVLDQLFNEKDTWPQKDVIEQLSDAGCSTDQKTLDKARAKMGIISRPVHIAKGKFASWVWTTNIEKQRVQDARQDSKDSKDSNDENPFD